MFVQSQAAQVVADVGALGVLAVAACQPGSIPTALAIQTAGLLAIIAWSVAVMAAGVFIAVELEKAVLRVRADRRRRHARDKIPG